MVAPGTLDCSSFALLSLRCLGRRACVKAHKLALLAQRAFWRSLLRDSLQLKDILTSFKNMEAAEQVAVSVYKRVLERYPQASICVISRVPGSLCRLQGSWPAARPGRHNSHPGLPACLPAIQSNPMTCRCVPLTVPHCRAASCSRCGAGSKSGCCTTRTGQPGAMQKPSSGDWETTCSTSQVGVACTNAALRTVTVSAATKPDHAWQTAAGAPQYC